MILFGGFIIADDLPQIYFIENLLELEVTIYDNVERKAFNRWT